MRVLTIYLVIVHPLEEEKFFGLSWRRELEFSHFGAPPKKMTCSLSLPFGRRRCGLKGWMEFLSPAFSLSLSLFLVPWMAFWVWLLLRILWANSIPGYSARI